MFWRPTSDIVQVNGLCAESFELRESDLRNWRPRILGLGLSHSSRLLF